MYSFFLPKVQKQCQNNTGPKDYVEKQKRKYLLHIQCNFDQGLVISLAVTKYLFVAAVTKKETFDEIRFYFGFWRRLWMDIQGGTTSRLVHDLCTFLPLTQYRTELRTVGFFFFFKLVLKGTSALTFLHDPEPIMNICNKCEANARVPWNPTLELLTSLIVLRIGQFGVFPIKNKCIGFKDSRFLWYMWRSETMYTGS